MSVIISLPAFQYKKPTMTWGSHKDILDDRDHRNSGVMYLDGVANYRSHSVVSAHRTTSSYSDVKFRFFNVL